MLMSLAGREHGRSIPFSDLRGNTEHRVVSRPSWGEGKLRHEIMCPFVLAKGKPLRTLRDAGEHVAALSQKEADKSHWKVAASCLLQASEKGGGFVVMARIAMVRALKGR
jgi:hypothetical protein